VPGATRRLPRWLAGPALVLTLAAVGIAHAATGSSHDLRHQAEEARDRAAEARQHEQAIAGDIAAQSARIDSVEAAIGALARELAQLEGQLGRSKSRLQALEDELAAKTRILIGARRQLGLVRAHLSRRLVEIYTSEQPDALSVVLGARSLEEMLELLDAQSRVVENDGRLVSQIENLRVRVTRERAQTARLRKKQAVETARIASRTNERRAAVAQLVARRDSLSAMRAARQQSLASVQVQRREWEAQADALDDESRRLAAVITATPQPISQPSPDVEAATPPAAAPSSSGFVWPVRGTLVSPYGQRWGRLHAGIDIAAPAGTPIVASASGQVIYAGSMSGYGLLVVIQHPGGIATAYAHNSSIAVSVGQPVGQGQTIAAVGCTGTCFGDHLHFEVRVGGSPVDPLGYL
jgi:murein DD-endopeptidase MepM/ murein hydrolase activator NlpD